MSKAGKKRKHEAKMKEKRAKKAAKKAAYAARAGTSKKAKRQRRFAQKSTTSSIYKHAHIMADCGNVGCQKCYPRKIRRKA